MNLKKNWIIIVIIVLIVAAGAFFLGKGTKGTQEASLLSLDIKNSPMRTDVNIQTQPDGKCTVIIRVWDDVTGKLLSSTFHYGTTKTDDKGYVTCSYAAIKPTDANTKNIIQSTTNQIPTIQTTQTQLMR